MKSSRHDRFAGRLDRLAGRILRFLGRLTGRRSLVLKGKAASARGALRTGRARAKHQLRVRG
jgi:uncharacterized protein YjbJ (UPF0337 family)